VLGNTAVTVSDPKNRRAEKRDFRATKSVERQRPCILSIRRTPRLAEAITIPFVGGSAAPCIFWCGKSGMRAGKKRKRKGPAGRELLVYGFKGAMLPDCGEHAGMMG